MLLISCHKEDKTILISLNKISACGVEDPLNDLLWLHEIALKSITDRTGNYLGSIWIKKYTEKDIIVTNMALGSGGVAFYTFDCDGNNVLITDISFYNSLTDKDKIFTSIKNK